MYLLNRNEIRKLKIGTRLIHIYEPYQSINNFNDLTTQKMYVFTIVDDTCGVFDNNVRIRLDSVGNDDNKYFLPETDSDLALIERTLYYNEGHCSDSI